MIDWTTDCGETAASHAIQYGDVEILKLLIKEGAQLTSDKTDRINLLDCAYGYLRTAEGTVKEIINFCKQDGSPNKLKQVCALINYIASWFC